MPEIKDILSGDQRCGSKLIRMIEDCDPKGFELLKQLYSHAGNAFVIGVTGAPGVGKSSLIDALIAEFRNSGFKVGVIAVDPSSPYSGGAILGDRIRMQRHAGDENVFIRSMASRGKKGGLSQAAGSAALVLDAMGYDIIMIETVGAGQSEFDIADIAHCTAIVTIAESGDGVQAAKAGILETGHIFIVNKADRSETDAGNAGRRLEMMLEMKKPREDGWKCKVLITSAAGKTGIKKLAQAFLDRRKFMEKDSRMQAQIQKIKTIYFRDFFRDLAMEKIMESLEKSDEFNCQIRKINSGLTDPITAARKMADMVGICTGKDNIKPLRTEGAKER